MKKLSVLFVVLSLLAAYCSSSDIKDSRPDLSRKKVRTITVTAICLDHTIVYDTGKIEVKLVDTLYKVGDVIYREAIDSDVVTETIIP